MIEFENRVFTKATECPQCGAPLKVENTPDWVIRTCSEDYAHFISQMPTPCARRKHVIETIASTEKHAGELQDSTEFFEFLQSLSPKQKRRTDAEATA